MSGVVGTLESYYIDSPVLHQEASQQKICALGKKEAANKLIISSCTPNHATILLLYGLLYVLPTMLRYERTLYVVGSSPTCFSLPCTTLHYLAYFSTLLSGEYRCWSFLDYVEDIYLAGWSSSSELPKKPLLPFVPLFTICITSPKTVYAIYCIYLIATL